MLDKKISGGYFMFNIGDFIDEFFGYIKNTVSSVGVFDIIDIIIVSVIIYYAVKFIRDRRAAKLLLGIFFLLVVYFISGALHIYVLGFLSKSLFQVGIIALIILFQPELRSLLEKVGGTSINTINRIGIPDQRSTQKIINSIDIISKSAADFSAIRRGALIVIERTTKLGDIVKTGTIINAELSLPLLGNIFYDKAPLHDGAVIISNNLIEAAGCVIPYISNSTEIPANVGTRHRAGVGISENSDAVVVIVSEETGTISVALDGKLERKFNIYTLRKKLTDLLFENSSVKTNKANKTNKNPKNKKSAKKGE